MLRGLLFATFFLGACGADDGEFCAGQYDTACVQEAFETETACNAAGSNGAGRGCSIEFEAYLECLNTSLDCGTCEMLAQNYSDCTATGSAVCNHYSRIDQGCFMDRPDCPAILDEPRNAECFDEWRTLMYCFATSDPADGDCVEQCMEESVTFFGC